MGQVCCVARRPAGIAGTNMAASSMAALFVPSCESVVFTLTMGPGEEMFTVHACGWTSDALMLSDCLSSACAAGAIGMPHAEAEWLIDNGQGGLKGWWSRSQGPGGSYVVPAVLLTGLALTGVAAFVYMRRRRMV